jgi:hypothetical protein
MEYPSSNTAPHTNETGSSGASPPQAGNTDPRAITAAQRKLDDCLPDPETATFTSAPL